MAEPDEWLPRLQFGEQVDEIPHYDCPDRFTMKIYHGGYCNHVEGTYVGGTYNYYDGVVKDKMSLIEIDGMVKGINPQYIGRRIDYWYSCGSELGPKTKLSDDNDVLRMCNLVPNSRLIVLWLDILELHPNYNEDYLDDLFMYDHQIHGWSQSQRGSTNVVLEELSDSPKKKCGVQIVELLDEVPTQVSSASNLQLATCKRKRKMEVHELEPDEDDGEDDDYDPSKNDHEEASYGIDDDYLFNWLTEPEGKEIDDEEALPTNEEGLKGGEEDEDDEEFFRAVESDEEVIGDEICSGEEDDEKKWPEFNPKVDMQNPRFCNGLLFPTPQILKAAIQERAIQNGWEPCYVKDDQVRVRCICKAEDCEFELCASKMQQSNTFQIRKYQPKHNCARVEYNRAVRTPYLVAKFTDFIQMNPDIKTEVLRKNMSKGIKSKVSWQQAYRTKKAALAQLEKSIVEQYARVQDYAAELKRVDPNTTVDIKCDFNNLAKQPVFQRIYVCLGALKEGFKAGCRPILGLDGCHLKNPYGGQLLSAVGLDANNCTYVVAYAMVEMETKDSWTWFLRLLEKDLKIAREGIGFTFISDKQKGLLPACELVFPLADHRFCVRHLWTNFNKKYPGKALKDQLWAIAKSTAMAYYFKEMTTMNQLDPEAYEWLTDPEEPTRNPKHWCRSHFNGGLKCDMLVNNLCESFNAFILPERPKPVISCFEGIRVKLMKRIAVRKQKMSKVVDTICPKPREILEKNKVRASSDCFPKATGSHKIEVESNGATSYVVDMRMRTCACRRWDLMGIPCKHAVAAIYFNREKPEDYVDDCYLINTYHAIYSHTIQPVNGMELWMPSSQPAILPPQYNRQPGRPKTKRIKDASEKETDGVKLGRVQKSVKCSNCNKLGHNVKTCHRHLPPKQPVANAQKKKKLNTGEASSTKPKGTRPPPKSKNELRANLANKAKIQKQKRDEAKAAAKALAAATSKGKPPKIPKDGSTSAQGSQSSTRSSARHRGKNAGK